MHYFFGMVLVAVLAWPVSLVANDEPWYEHPEQHLKIIPKVADTIWHKPTAKSDLSPGCCITISVSYPTISGAPSSETDQNLNTIVRLFLKDHLELPKGETMEEWVRMQLDTLIQLWSDFPQDKPSKYIINTTYVTFLKHGLMTLQMEEYSYPGGYRNRYRCKAGNYDLRTYVPLQLEHLFVKGFRSRLDSMGEGAFRKYLRLPKNVQLEKYGYFVAHGFSLNENAAITDSGMVFTFNECEINGCNAGFSRAYLSWEQLKPVIRPDGPLGWVLKED